VAACKRSLSTRTPTVTPASACRQIIDGRARREQSRMMVDGLTAADDLGLTTAVPASIVIHTDARWQTIRLDSLTIVFKRRGCRRSHC
jgi:hypothetical protein